MNVFGSRFLVPHRKDPLTLDMIKAIADIPCGASVGNRPWEPQSFEAVQLVDMLSFMIITGFRLGELVYHNSDEFMYLVWSDVTAVIGGVTYSDPSEAQWASMATGDYIVVVPPRSKTDQFGEVHCPYPCIIPFENTVLNAARRVRDAALRRPCHGEARDTTPLFADSGGRPHSHARLDALLRKALTYTVGPERAALYSWHSARIGLACALRAVNCPPETVQLICRWMCPESLRVYALKGTSEHALWVTKAMDANVDAVRGTSYPVIGAADGLVRMQDELAQQWTLEREQDAERTPLEPTARVTPVRRRYPEGRPPLPSRNPRLRALLDDARVVCPDRAKVAERQRLLLVAHPALAECYEVPPAILAAAGLAAGSPDAPSEAEGDRPERPPEGIRDAD